MSKKTEAADKLILDMRVLGWLPQFEYRFHATRKWRFDVCFPEHKLAVEIDGGTWSVSRHTTGAGFEADCEKLNEAVLLGWRVLRFTTTMVSRGEALMAIERGLKLSDYENRVKA